CLNESDPSSIPAPGLWTESPGGVQSSGRGCAAASGQGHLTADDRRWFAVYLAGGLAPAAPCGARFTALLRSIRRRFIYAIGVAFPPASAVECPCDRAGTAFFARSPLRPGRRHGPDRGPGFASA